MRIRFASGTPIAGRRLTKRYARRPRANTIKLTCIRRKAVPFFERGTGTNRLGRFSHLAPRPTNLSSGRRSALSSGQLSQDYQLVLVKSWSYSRDGLIPTCHSKVSDCTSPLIRTLIRRATTKSHVRPGGVVPLQATESYPAIYNYEPASLQTAKACELREDRRAKRLAHSADLVLFHGWLLAPVFVNRFSGRFRPSSSLNVFPE